MDPSAAWRCSPGLLRVSRAAVAVVNPWILVLVGSAAQGCWGAVAVVNPWILVQLRVLASGAFGMLSL